MHPCCGESLQTGTKIIAIVEIVLNIITMIFLLAFLFFGAFIGAVAYTNDANKSSAGAGVTYNQDKGTFETSTDVQLTDDDKKGFLAVGLVLTLVSLTSLLFVIIGLVMSIILLKGAKERNIGKCRVWLIYTAVWWCISVVMILFGYFPAIFGLPLTAYFMWVVYAFIKEMEVEAGPGGPGVVYIQQVAPQQKV